MHEWFMKTGKTLHATAHVQRLRLEQEQDVVAGARGGAATKKWPCVDCVSVDFGLLVGNIPFFKILSCSQELPCSDIQVALGYAAPSRPDACKPQLLLLDNIWQYFQIGTAY